MTVGRELRRGKKRPRGRDAVYDPRISHKRATARRRTGLRFKLARQPDLATHVRQRLAMGLSPEQIAGRLTLEGFYLRISHESIYRFIWHKAACGDRSWSRLLASQKTRRGRQRHGGGPTMNGFTDYVSISERPAEVADRSIPGHWEADLMAFRQNSQFLLVAHERASRRAFIHKQPNKTAIAVRDTLTNLLRKMPKSMRKTITYDNGPEFARHHEINAALAIKSFFCNTRSPWQKGSIENGIGRLRRYLPRPTDIHAMPEKRLRAIIKAYNNTPRKCLGYLTPNEAFVIHQNQQRVALQA